MAPERPSLLEWSIPLAEGGVGESRKLFVTQGLGRVDARGAPGGQIAGNQSNQAQQGGDGRKGRRIPWLDALQLMPQQARQSGRRGQTRGSTGQDRAQRLPDDQLEHVTRGRPKGYPDGQLVRA